MQTAAENISANTYPACKVEFIEAYIYGLYDNEGNIFYVGITYRPLKDRLCGHLSESRMWNRYKKAFNGSDKVRKVVELKYKVDIQPLESVWIVNSKWFRNYKILAAKEAAWIKNLSSNGIELTNTRHNHRNKNAASTAML